MDLASEAPNDVVGILLVGRGPMMRRSDPRGDAGCRTSRTSQPDTAWRVRPHRPDIHRPTQPNHTARQDAKPSCRIRICITQACRCATSRTEKNARNSVRKARKISFTGPKTFMLSWLNVSEKTLWLAGDERILFLQSAKCRLDCNAAR